MSKYREIGEVMRAVGEQVTWEVLQSEGKWYVWLSNNAFKISDADETLEAAVEKVYNSAIIRGPRWLRDSIKRLGREVSRFESQSRDTQEAMADSAEDRRSAATKGEL